jgi:hypothetical protein
VTESRPFVFEFVALFFHDFVFSCLSVVPRSEPAVVFVAFFFVVSCFRGCSSFRFPGDL